MSAPGRPKRTMKFMTLRLLGWGLVSCGLALVFRAWVSPDMLLALANSTFFCG